MPFKASRILPVLLASSLFAPAPAAAPAAPVTRDLTVEQKHLANLTAPRSDLKITAWLDRRDATYRAGDAVRLFVKVNRDAYITVVNVGTSGKVHVLFPNRYQRNNRVLAHQVLEIPDSDTRYHIRAGGPAGTELIKVIATTRPGRIIPPDRLAERGPFSSFRGSTRDLARDLDIEIAEKYADVPEGGVAMVNKVIRILDERARPPRKAAAPADVSDLSAAELFRLGEASFYGDDGSPDYREALHLFRMAAEAGHVGAMYRIGRIHEAGMDVDRDPALARRWYRKAAQLGNTEAMVRLGLMHAKPDGPDRDYTAALRWFRKAAGNGNGTAMLNLAKMYDDGIGVERSPRDAARQILGALRAGVWTTLEQAATLSEAARRQVQAQLRHAGYYSGPIDGRIGPDTRAAMVKFARAA